MDRTSAHHDSERTKWNDYYASIAIEEEDPDARQLGEELVACVSELLPPGSRVLEAGCGAGWQALAFARSGRFRVGLLDFSEHALAHARALFAREDVSGDFVEADAFAPGPPEFDLVFNAGVLEHYTFDEQVALLRGMASRSRRYVLTLVPNRLCQWYWLWRVQKSSRGEWPYGKEVPRANLCSVFDAAGLHFLGQMFMAVPWTEGFIRRLDGIDPSLLDMALEVHRSPLLPAFQKAYLVAGLATVTREAPSRTALPSGWSPAPLPEDGQVAELTAAMSDALALRLGAETQFAKSIALLQEQISTAQRAADEARIRAEAAAAHERSRAAGEISRRDAEMHSLRTQLDAVRSDLRSAEQRRESLRSALQTEQHARQLLETTVAGEYRGAITAIRDVVRTSTPRKATVLVVSKGDEELLNLPDRAAWHFPRDEDGGYAGHYPADSGAAVAHLEELRARGAQFLLFPNAAFWWLEHYKGFRQHLDGRYQRVWSDERCVLYRLYERRRWWQLLRPRRAPATTSVFAPELEASIAPVPTAAASAYDVVCFPVIEWDFRFARPQQLASSFADAGHRVFYISQKFRPTGEPCRVLEKRKNVYEVSLRAPRLNIYKQVLTGHASEALLESLAVLKREWGVESAVSILHLPFWRPVAETLRDRHGWPMVYDLMDDHSGFSSIGASVLEQEEGLLASADLVVVTAPLLEQRARAYARNVRLVRNGCDYEHFASALPDPKRPARAGGRPVIGYFGAVAEWVDTDLVADVAQRHPEWDFVLVGSTFGGDLGRLRRLSNVALPGEKPYDEIATWVAGFDVGIIPFKRLPLTEAANPIKAYEILAAGKPLVSVPLPEMQAFGDLARLGSTADDFGAQIERALTDTAPAAVERRRAFAREHTWRMRYEVFDTAVRDVLRGNDSEIARAIEVPGLVSVVLPVYNQANLLRDSIRSVLAQSYDQFELIVVDDGSTDDIGPVLAEFNGHPKVRLLTQANQKLPKALSNGFEFARGEFWTWTSADNLMHREQLARQVAFLRSNVRAAMVYADYLAIDDRGEPLVDPSFRPHNRRSVHSAEIHLPRTTEQLNTVQDNFIGACFMYRASVGRVLGEYDPNLGVEDYDYWMRVNDLFRIEHLGTDDLLYEYRVHDNTLNARAGELKILDRVQELMRYEEQRAAFYREPWIVHADTRTLRWLKHVDAGPHEIREWQPHAPITRGSSAKRMLLVHVDSLPQLHGRYGEGADYVAAWLDADDDPRAPYRRRLELQETAGVCFAADGASADRCDLFASKVIVAAPGGTLFGLATAAANNDVFYRTTRPADARRRRCPDVFVPPDQRLHVLFQADDFTAGGLEQVVLDLAAGLDRRRFDVTLLVLGREGPAAERARQAGLSVVSLRDGEPAERETAYRELLSDRGVGLVNAHYSLFGAGVAAREGIPFVQTIHNTYVWLGPDDVAAYRSNDAVTSAYVCVSGAVALYADVRLGLPAGKTVVVPNGIDLTRVQAPSRDQEQERQRLREEFGLSARDFVFLNVASIHPPKAQREIVRAMAQVVPMVPATKVILLGAALDRGYLAELQREIAAAGLERSVVVAGHRDDVTSFYYAADAFLLPSFWEGWSLALTEAVCAGLPVVATDVGGARDLLARSGGGYRLVRPPFDCITDLCAGNIGSYLKRDHEEFVRDLATAMRETCESGIRPSLPAGVREQLGRDVAYAAYEHLFRWLAQGGHPAATRAWFAGPVKAASPTYLHQTAP
jgi:glycosyltransferase involved in cell wall biosynthesis/SAM-dependent methyltransferase